MTPLTLTRPSTIVPLETDNRAALAILPLSFTAQRQCKNKEVMAAIIDVLSDKCSSDQHIATIFRNAFKHNCCSDLNRIIRNSNALHGPDTVVVNRNVVALLADEAIDLIQNTDGSVEMCRPIATFSSPDRHAAIGHGADPALGDDVLKLICTYDDEINICAKNEKEILSILCSDDVTAKNLLFAAASHQRNAIPYLNTLFPQLREKDIPLDLSGTDLSNLDLSNIILINADLRHANLRGATLTNAVFYGADLRYADLTNANLSQATLGAADLSHARLICANLFIANLASANLSNALLLCADMRGVDMGAAWRVGGALFNFANMKHIKFVDDFARLNFLLKNLNGETTKLTTPFACQYEHQANSDGLFEQVINRHFLGSLILTPSEKNILLAHGVATTENEDGTVKLHRITIAKQQVLRHEIIDSTLATIGFPKEPAELIAAFDDDIEICDENREVITDILKSTDQFAKGQLIAMASRQHSIAVLNEIVSAFLTIPLDLSGVDLSNLDLTGINLTGANLCGANLQHSCLQRAWMHGAVLSHANLNGADLTEAILNRADLSHARLIAAQLLKTQLRGANLHRTVLIAATLDSPGLYGQLLESVNPFLQIKNNDFPRAFIFRNLNAPLTVSIFSDIDDSDQSTSPPSSRLPPGGSEHLTVAITSAEKQLLLERGFKLKDNRNGTFQLSKPVRMVKDPDRAQLIDTTLTGTLPKALTDLISDYDVEIDISEANETALLDILKSDDPVAKAELIAAASHQLQIDFLNTLFQKIKWEKVTLDLSHVDMSNLDLHGINLCDANLNGAILHGANLNGARLESAEFFNADLTDARMLKADLSHAVFIGATLRRAVLKFANLAESDFRGEADLTGALLDHANLNDANFCSANLTNASLIHAKMHETRLDTANLTHARLMYGELVCSSLVAANLTSANFSHATLDRVSLTLNPIWNGAKWSGASFHQIRSDKQSRKNMPIRMWMNCQ